MPEYFDDFLYYYKPLMDGSVLHVLRHNVPILQCHNTCTCMLVVLRWMTVLYSRKQATLKQESGKRGGEGDEERENLVEGEEDSRSKSFSTLLYEDKVLCSYTC